MDVDWNKTHAFFRQRRFKLFEQRILDYLEDKQNRPLRILDVGCHDGGFLFELAKRIGGRHNVELYGLDIVGKIINVAEARNRALGSPVKHFWTMDIEKEIPEGMFDVICMQEIVEHLRDPERVLRRLVERIVPGGILLLSSINRGCLVQRLARMLWTISGGRLRNWYWSGSVRGALPPMSKSREFREGVIHGHISARSAGAWKKCIEAMGMICVKRSATHLFGGSYFWVQDPNLFGLARVLDGVAIRSVWGTRCSIGFLLEFCRPRGHPPSAHHRIDP